MMNILHFGSPISSTEILEKEFKDFERQYTMKISAQ